jgi:hypothetical protein
VAVDSGTLVDTKLANDCLSAELGDVATKARFGEYILAWAEVVAGLGIAVDLAGKAGMAGWVKLEAEDQSADDTQSYQPRNIAVWGQFADVL